MCVAMNINEVKQKQI